MQETSWHLQVFGGLLAQRGKQSLERFRTQKTAALLALLALRGKQSREEVCALLWPDTLPESARNSLSAALSALRRDLGEDAVRADRQSVALAPGAAETDVALFDAALKTGEVARAVDLYRGHLLPGFHDEPFPALSREYEEKARGAFQLRLEELEDNGQCDELLAVARRAASLFGDNERWFLAQMRAHFGLGDFDAALRAYDALGRFNRKSGDTASDSARLLAKTIRREREDASRQAEEMGKWGAEEQNKVSKAEAIPAVQSSPALSISSAPPLAPVPLPTPWTRFFGREAERALLAGWLRDGQKLVTLSGAGGSGKTRLALETLRELSSDFEGDIAFAPLAALSDPDLIFPAIRDALGLTATPETAPLDQLQRALAGRRVVLFLDNFEQLVGGGAQRLQSLRERVPGATILVTSRVLLQLPGEREFPVSPLPTPLSNTNAAQVRGCASAALFCDRAGLVLDDNNAGPVGALCRRLDGIPLALELAAARAKVLSPAQILERLQKHPDFLSSRELGVPARHKTLRATIEWSTDLLSPEVKAFWTRLSLFQGGWSLEAAERVAAPGICDDVDTLDFLTLLRECSLIVTVEEASAGTRFRMLQTLREFGREQLQDPEDALRAHFEFFLELAGEAASAMQGPEQTTWLSRLDAEQDNLRAALSWAKRNDAPRGLQLATSLIDFWETRLSLDEGREWIETFLNATQNREAAPARSRALSGAGRLAWYAADFKEADALLEQGLHAAKQTGDAGDIIYSMHSAARLAAVAGETARAQELGRESVRLARESGERAPLLAALIDLAPAFVVTGDWTSLRATCDEALTLSRQEGDGHALAVALYLHGIGDYHQGHFERARPLLEESEALCRGFDSRWDLMICLGTLANVLREQNQLAASSRAFHETLSICREAALGDHNVATMTLTSSYLLVKRGQAREAVHLMGGCEKWREAVNVELMPFMASDDARYQNQARAMLGEAAFALAWQEGRALSPTQTLDAAIEMLPQNAMANAATLATRSRALSGAGRLAWYANDLSSASARLEEGLRAAKQSGDEAALVYATRTSSRVAAIGGELERGRELGREGVRLARESSNSSLLLKSLLDLAFADFNDGDFDSVERHASEALALARTGRDESSLALALSLLANKREQEERQDEALALIQESDALCRRLGLGWELTVALALQGQIWSKRGDVARSQGFYNEALNLCRETSLSTWYVVTTLSSMSWAWVRRGAAREAATIMGAARALSEAIGYSLMPILVPVQEEFEREARAMIGSAAFEAAWARGHNMTPERAVDFALNGGAASVEDTPSPPTPGDAHLLATRARALSGAGRLAWHDSDFAKSRALVEEGLDAAQTSGDAASFVAAVASFVRLMSVSGDVGDDLARGRALAEKAVARARGANDEALLLEALISLGYAGVMRLDDNSEARAVHEEAVVLARKLGDDLQLATALVSLAVTHYLDEEFERADEIIDEAYVLARRVDSPFLQFAALWLRCHIAREEGDFERSHAAAKEALELCKDNAGFKWSVSNVLLAAAFLLVKAGAASRGVELASAAQANSESFGYRMAPMLRFDFDRSVELARQGLSEEEFEGAWKRGRRLNIEEAIELAERPLEPSTELSGTRARALSGAGRLAWHGSDMKASRELVQEGLRAARQAGDTRSFVVAVSAFVLFAMSSGDIEGLIAQSRELSEEAVARARRDNDKTLLLESLVSLSYALTIVGRFDESRATTDEAIALARELGDEGTLVRVLNNRATIEYHQGRLSVGRALLDESEPIARRLGSPWDVLVCLWTRSALARKQGDLSMAHKSIAEALEVCRAASFRWGVSNVLLTASYNFVEDGRPHIAARLMGAGLALGESLGYHIVPVLRPEFERFQAQAREMLGEEAFEDALEEGRALSPEQAMELVIQPPSLPARDAQLLAARSRALSGAGRLAWHGSDRENSRDLVLQGLDAAREASDLTSFVYAVAAFVRFALTTGEHEGFMAQACELSEEAVTRSKQAGDKALWLESLTSLGYSHTVTGHLKEAHNANTQAIALARELGDETNLARVLTLQAAVWYHERHFAPARALAEESAALCRRLSSAWDLIAAQWMLSNIAREQGELDVALRAITEVLEIERANPTFRWGVANALLSMSYLRLALGQQRLAALLMGNAQRLWEETGYHLAPVQRSEDERYRALTRKQLGEAEWTKAWEEGRAMTPEAAMELALGGLE